MVQTEVVKWHGRGGGKCLCYLFDDLKNFSIFESFVSEHFGECFVFIVAGRSGPGLLTTDIPRGPDVTVYRWVGPDDQASHLSRTHCDEEVVCTSTPLTPPPQVVNDMFAYATPEVLGFGSGGDGFALRLDETLE